MVEHCGGPKTDGDFVHTLTMTDIASGWTECVAMRIREQMLIVEAFDEVASELWLVNASHPVVNRRQQRPADV